MITEEGLPLKPIFVPQCAELQNGQLIFEHPNSFKEALEAGCFFLKIPSYIDVNPGVTLCHNFYKEKDGSNDAYQGFKEFSFYTDRQHYQIEHIMLNKALRKQYFPSEVNVMCDAMTDVAFAVLKNTLAYLNIPQQDWALATNNANTNSGIQWFGFCHYRSALERKGLPPHQDGSFITVLYINEPGLEGLIHNQWQKINAREGYFVVNFGQPFEILTKHLSTPVKSMLHRVTRINKCPTESDRIALVAFLNPSAEGDLYQYNADMSLKPYQTVEDFFLEFNKKVWDDETPTFGLKV